jgi:hypothetical protein
MSKCQYDEFTFVYRKIIMILKINIRSRIFNFIAFIMNMKR